MIDIKPLYKMRILLSKIVSNSCIHFINFEQNFDYVTDNIIGILNLKITCHEEYNNVPFLGMGLSSGEHFW